ncbi:hypothetical protein [Micromonospora narathiwatensis]|uniref:hypothetical protein n=1 Tax=Micromonospora narathiwatensis TaxID=299146 RepID=UPI001430B0D9|nr:hypothetical protein [Micromonospora narathiwatensis]
MTCSQISDPTVLADYQAVLQPGAALAGPLADTLRRGELDQTALDWLQTNFYKTELELGHCLRLPQEGPCECDIYLTRPKFVTTPQSRPSATGTVTHRGTTHRRCHRARLGP